MFTEQLKDLCCAQTQLTVALPKMVKKASTTSLSEALEHLLEQREVNVERRIGHLLGITLTGQKCKGMEGVLVMRHQVDVPRLSLSLPVASVPYVSINTLIVIRQL